MKLREIRYNNVRRLVKEAGLLKNFAERLGKAEAQCSSFAGSNPRKGIGDSVAEDIEKCFGLPPGWLDENRDAAKSELIESSPVSDAGDQPGAKSQKAFDTYTALIELGREVQDFGPQEWAEMKAYARLIRARKGDES